MALVPGQSSGREVWRIPCLLFIGCVTLGSSFRLSEQQFSHLTNGDITTLRQLKGLREIMRVLCK